MCSAAQRYRTAMFATIMTTALLGVIVWFVWASPAAAVGRPTGGHPTQGVSVAGLPAPTWMTETNMPTARYGLATATGPDGLIYAIGGLAGTTALDTLEAYNPTTGLWSCSTDDTSSGCTDHTLIPMPTARYDLAAATGPDGTIYAIGGTDGANSLDTVEAYNPSTDSWTTVMHMKKVRYGLAAATSDGHVYAIGGNNSSFLDTVEAYDPSTDSWATVTPMNTHRYGLAATTGFDGVIYAIGGSNGSDLDTVEAYTPSTNSWAAVASMSTGRRGLATSRGSDGIIYAIGGYNGSYLDTVEAYSPSTGVWTTIASLQTARWFLGAATGFDGSIYAIGGSDGIDLDTVEAYNPTIPTDTATATLAPVATDTPTATPTETDTRTATPTNTKTSVPIVTASETTTPVGTRVWRVYLPAVDVPLPSPTATPTVVSSSTATPIPNPIQNPGFEVNGLQGWTPGSTNHVSTPVVSTTTANSGTHSALLGDPNYPCFGAPSYGYSYLSQQVVVPAGTQPTLTFYIDMHSQDYQHDGFAVYANNLGSLADLLLDSIIQPTNPSGGENPCVETVYHWKKYSVSIPSKYLGKPLTLYFVNETTDQNWNTWTYLDDVSISFP